MADFYSSNNYLYHSPSTSQLCTTSCRCVTSDSNNAWNIRCEGVLKIFMPPPHQSISKNCTRVHFPSPHRQIKSWLFKPLLVANWIWCHSPRDICVVRGPSLQRDVFLRSRTTSFTKERTLISPFSTSVCAFQSVFLSPALGAIWVSSQLVLPGPNT